MNEDTIERLKAAAPAIEKFRQLHPDEQAWLVDLLQCGKSALNALNVLDSISNVPLTYQEIASDCKLHPTSVKQILGALTEGGCRVDLSNKTAFAPTGRPRTLARR